jgi:hypothetical protein
LRLKRLSKIFNNLGIRVIGCECLNALCYGRQPLAYQAQSFRRLADGLFVDVENDFTHCNLHYCSVIEPEEPLLENA